MGKKGRRFVSGTMGTEVSSGAATSVGAWLLLVAFIVWAVTKIGTNEAEKSEAVKLTVDIPLMRSKWIFGE